MTEQQMHSIRLAIGHLQKQEDDAKLVLAQVQRQVEKRRKELHELCDHTYSNGVSAFYEYCHICGRYYL